MIEVAIAVVACAILAGLLCWYDRPTDSEWDALLSPEAEEIERFLWAKFDAEGRAMDWSLRRAVAEMDRTEGLRLLAASGAYIAELVPERLALLRRLEFYSRLAGAIGPLPGKSQLSTVRRAFGALRRVPEPAQLVHTSQEFRRLDAQTLEGWRFLLCRARTLAQKEE